MRLWADAGVFDLLFDAIQDHYMIRVSVDCLGLGSTSIKVHKGSAGAPKKTTRKRLENLSTDETVVVFTTCFAEVSTINDVFCNLSGRIVPYEHFMETNSAAKQEFSGTERVVTPIAIARSLTLISNIDLLPLSCWLLHFVLRAVRC